MVFVSGTPTTSAGLGAAVIDADTGNVLFSQASFTRHGHWLASDSGSVGNPTQYWLSRWTGGGTRSVDVRSLPDFSVLGTFNFGLNNATPAAESTTSVLYVGDFNTGTGVRLVNKLTLGIASFVLPAGWRFFASPSQPAALVSPSGIEEFLLPVQSIASSSVFGFVNLGLSGFGTVRQTVGSGLTTPTFFAGSCVVEEKVYWIAYDSPDNETYIVETDLAGDVLRIIPIYDFSPTGIYSGSTRKALVYVPETNGLYYTRNNELWRYSLTSDTYSKCAPAFAPEITAFGSVVTGRGGAIAYQTGTMWFCVMRISGGGTVIGYALENVPIE